MIECDPNVFYFMKNDRVLKLKEERPEQNCLKDWKSGRGVFVSKPGNFWRVPSLSTSVTAAQHCPLNLSSPFPLTTNTTHYHSSWSRKRTSFPRQASPECSYLACQKILRSPRSTTRCIRKRPQKGVPEKVNQSFLVITVVDSNLYRALRLHPDKGGDPELFKEVTHA